MTIIESITEYIKQLNCIKDFERIINVNYLSEDESFSIEEIPCEPVIKKYIGGKTLRQFQFSFCGKEPYTAEIIQNLDNSGFYEIFADEIENKNDNGILPLIKKGLEAKSIEVTSSSYCLRADEDKAIYQINLNLKYYKGAC